MSALLRGQTSLCAWWLFQQHWGIQPFFPSTERVLCVDGRDLWVSDVEGGKQEAVAARCWLEIGCALLLWSPLAQTGWGDLTGLAAGAPRASMLAGALWMIKGNLHPCANTGQWLVLSALPHVVNVLHAILLYLLFHYKIVHGKVVYRQNRWKFWCWVHF